MYTIYPKFVHQGGWKELEDFLGKFWDSLLSNNHWFLFIIVLVVLLLILFNTSTGGNPRYKKNSKYMDVNTYALKKNTEDELDTRTETQELCSNFVEWKFFMRNCAKLKKFINFWIYERFVCSDFPKKLNIFSRYCSISIIGTGVKQHTEFLSARAKTTQDVALGKFSEWFLTKMWN